MPRPTATAILLYALAPAALAGPLSPAAGPVAPAFKTLTDVEPRTPLSPSTTPGDATSVHIITQPGSYYLAANVLGAPGKHGVTIAADNVTLDLNGFTVDGGGSASGSLTGVRAPNQRNAVVRNGVVRGWGGSGIALGVNALVADVIADANASANISVAAAAVLDRCIARSGANIGFSAGADAVIRACAARDNAGFGFTTGLGCALESCESRANGAGFVASGGSTYHACAAYANTGIGFDVSQSVLAACAAVANGSQGINAGTGSQVRDCVATTNASHGIAAVSRCLVLANTAYGNGTGPGVTDGAGLYLGGSDNRAEGNNLATNDYGLYTNAAGNLIVRNSLSGNATNVVIGIGNVVGPVIAGTTNPSPIVGATYATGAGTTDPYANILY